jgi:acyl-coenzyme A thioesterase PaaI-like protein
LGDELVAEAKPLHVGRSTAAIEVRIDRIREGASKLAANLIVTQFVMPPR